MNRQPPVLRINTVTKARPGYLSSYAVESKVVPFYSHSPKLLTFINYPLSLKSLGFHLV
nr:MAG TPA: hypothetical protein [Caudoviricetes sp.]